MRRTFLLFLISIAILPCIFFSCSKQNAEEPKEEDRQSIFYGEWTDFPSLDLRERSIRFECLYFHEDGKVEAYEKTFYMDDNSIFMKNSMTYAFKSVGTWEYLPIDETNGYLTIATAYESNTNKVTFEKTDTELLMRLNNSTTEYLIKDNIKRFSGLEDYEPTLP